MAQVSLPSLGGEKGVLFLFRVRLGSLLEPEGALRGTSEERKGNGASLVEQVEREAREKFL